MDSIHKTVMVGFLRAFHTDVQNASKLSKIRLVHTYQSFLLYGQMVNLPLDSQREGGVRSVSSEVPDYNGTCS